MLNFNCSIPTKIFFGRGRISELPHQIKQYSDNILLVYGGGSIKKIGLYQEVIRLLEENKIAYTELSGVEPNPRIDSVRKGIELCREKNIGLVLAVGGGSTIDVAKVIAGGVAYEGDAWDIVLKPSNITKVLPIASILTLSATGSEMDTSAVISNLETHQKYGTYHEDFAPKFSILDPTYTFSVSKYQTASGTADIISHIFEEYFNRNKEAYISDKLAEALLKTCIKYGPIAYEQPENYEARSNLMWASSLAINDLLSFGKEGRWTVHPLEHELSAYFDITHGVGLAILTPHWMRHVLNSETRYKFVEYGVNIWDIDPTLPEEEIAEKAIACTHDFFVSLGIPDKLSEVGISEDKLEIMADAVIRRNGGTVGSFVPLNKEDVLAIYRSAM